MKKIVCITAACMALTLTACDDYLTVSSPDNLTSESFWRDKTDVEAAISAAYSQLYFMDGSTDKWTMCEVLWPVEAYREDLVKPGNDAMNYQNWVELYNFTYTNGNSQFSNYWRHLYRGANFASQILEKMAKVPTDKLSEDERTRLQAEAHFLRGYYHMRLLLNWEQIIIRDKYITSGDRAALDKALSARPDCWTLSSANSKRLRHFPRPMDPMMWDGPPVAPLMPIWAGHGSPVRPRKRRPNISPRRWRPLTR